MINACFTVDDFHEDSWFTWSNSQIRYARSLKNINYEMLSKYSNFHLHHFLPTSPLVMDILKTSISDHVPIMFCLISSPSPPRHFLP